MWVEPWKREGWVISRAGLRYLWCAFWGQIPFFLACPLLIYWGEHSYLGRATPLESFPIRVLFGLMGGAFAISAFALDDAMKVFRRNRENSGETPGRIWRIILVFGIFGGSAAYFWFVYRTRMQEAGFLKR